MGPISKLQEIQNDLTIKKMKENEAQKQKLKITGFKDIGPNAKKYKLNQNQKNFQTTGRITIAAIAAILGISGAAIINNHSNVPTNPTSETQVVLDKDELLSEANEKLYDIVFGTDRKEANYYVGYKYDRHDNSSKMIVGRQLKPIGNTFQYRHETGYIYDNGQFNFKDAKEIKDLANIMIDIHYSENPSQKDLEKLNEAIEALEDKNFKLDGQNIVPVKQQDTELEL